METEIRIWLWPERADGQCCLLIRVPHSANQPRITEPREAQEAQKLNPTQKATVTAHQSEVCDLTDSVEDRRGADVTKEMS